MRLAQLARKLSLKSTAIVDFLAAQGVAIDDSPNAKVDEVHARAVISHFAPALLDVEETIPHEPENTLEAPKEETIEIPEPSDESEVMEEVDEVENEVASSIETVEELPDVIRAPKIELSGLKVLGKIELPEKKKKEESEVINESGEVLIEESVTEPRIKPREKKFTDRKRIERPRRNTLSEARERERREEEEKRKAEEEKRKELRKQKYLQTRQAKAPSRAEKVKVEKEVKKAPAKKKKEESVSLLTRFMRWLTSNQT
ncbi:hypothetical protein SanaruYs_26050 [Chryseotalea sanaruensis]|uniref:Translation initiation factor IF-2 N-terminal domain-containing protein n=1 Tax=Chryseotalea sanaruensis TaxID=2482724 RepID=A0A401UBT2_9BACT|nr:hypothetical protein [Chryseotalea sanaruensis]GCC52368.1 hypothetical protein SanaruYs_26050 [Chryseotalea sanaruensis]